jgi:GNAT superfamily N-acetyltransferase
MTPRSKATATAATIPVSGANSPQIGAGHIRQGGLSDEASKSGILQPPLSAMSVTLRLLESTDAEAISALLPDLGYEATADQVVRRLAALRDWPDQEAFVAMIDDRIVGLCHVQGVRLLASDGYAEIQALVVSTAVQGQGLGRQLVDHACAWAHARGYERVRLRSNVVREAAHAFYEHLGFEKAKASYAFERRRS